jgi:hypothetical protein
MAPGLCDIDANNMYAPVYVGYYSYAMTSISAWQNLFTSDQNSVSTLPNFFNKKDHLKASYYYGLECSPLATVTEDIEGKPRTGFTPMGCYENNVYTTNASLGNLQIISLDTALGMQVTLFNVGNPITTAEIHWKFNNILQPPFVWLGSLGNKELETLLIDKNVLPVYGNNTVEVWIKNLGSQTDELPDDDTTRLAFYECPTLSGTIPVGHKSSLSTIADALEQLSLCGVDGDIVFALDSGEYSENIDLSDVSKLLNGYQLTITSATQKAEDVVFKITSGTGIKFLTQLGKNYPQKGV